MLFPNVVRPSTQSIYAPDPSLGPTVTRDFQRSRGRIVDGPDEIPRPSPGCQRDQISKHFLALSFPELVSSC